MIDPDERAARVKDFVKRFRWKGPVFEISALTREGCEALVQGVYRHVASFQVHHVEPDVRFDVAPPAESEPGFVPSADDPRFR
jgi:GTP-binding protein